jgi:asparagine synthase (glutamine-hydrolysing)
MSGIFGIFNRNGKPVEEKIVDTMLDAMSYWDPDERNTYIDGPVALGHTMLWNTPESKYEHLPLNKDVYILTMDARIDNRAKLIKELELPNRLLEEIGDSEFILAAYQKWGEESPKHLLGDFSFVIWDEKKQQLFCARDHIGIKPFYYYLDNEKFIFSNNIQGIISHPKVVKKFDDKAVAIYLREGQLMDSDLTFFESVYQLHPATTLVVSAEDVKRNTYWKIEDSPPVNYNSIEEYSDKLRELLEDAVHARIRSCYTVASHLSGGLDSSSIAVLAARYLASEEKLLYTYNWIPLPETGEDPDYWEWKNSKKIADLENINHCNLNMNVCDIADIYESIDISGNDTITFWYEHLVQKAAKKHNVRTMLSGCGGDVLISYNGYMYIAGLFWKGKIKRVLSLLYADVSKTRYPWLNLIRKFYRQVIVPILPEQLNCIINNFYCTPKNPLIYVHQNFRDLFKKFKFNKKVLNTIGVHEDQLSSYSYGHIQTRVDSWNASGFSNSIEYCYPLLDKRIVEFALGVPDELYRYKGKGRYLFQQAVQGIIPDEIRLSNTKYEPKRVNIFYNLLYRTQKNWINNIKKHNKHSTSEYINLNQFLKEMEMFNINDGIISKKEIEKLEIFEKYILLLGIGRKTINKK